MNFIIGRNNFAATVFVPYDCKNNCKFCTSKGEYKKNTRVSTPELHSFLSSMSKSNLVEDIVFTGGEPMSDIDTLSSMVANVANKNVFINTTLIKDKYFEFINIVNNTNAIKGINISRHEVSYEEDCKGFENIAEDWLIKGILKPVKINIVLNYNKFNTDDISNKAAVKTEIEKYIKRWESYSNVSLSFRLDYRYITTENLHNLTCDLISIFSEMFEYSGHTFCDVCDSVIFQKNGQTISIHRGLEHSSFKMGNNIVINDVIMFPDGTVTYDWDKKTSDELLTFLCKNIKQKKTREIGFQREEIKKEEISNEQISSCGVTSHCGSWAIKAPEKPYRNTSSCGISINRC